jgi:homoaconitate hydratase
MFRSWLGLRSTRCVRTYATVSSPQTRVEKIVQRYAVDLSPGTKVRAGDYVMIKPEHV